MGLGGRSPSGRRRPGSATASTASVRPKRSPREPGREVAQAARRQLQRGGLVLGAEQAGHGRDGRLRTGAPGRSRASRRRARARCARWPAPAVVRDARQTTPPSKRMVGSRGPCRSSPRVGQRVHLEVEPDQLVDIRLRLPPAPAPVMSRPRPRRRRRGSGPATTAPRTVMLIISAASGHWLACSPRCRDRRTAA